jgi:hypothetical protein
MALLAAGTDKTTVLIATALEVTALKETALEL